MKNNIEKTSRRQFIKVMGVAGAGLFLPWKGTLPRALAAIPGGTLLPSSIPKYLTPLLIPPVMPRAGVIKQRGGKQVDYYEISMDSSSSRFCRRVCLRPPSGATAQ